MRLFLIVLGFIAAIFAAILAATPLSNLAFFPAIVAIIIGIVLFFISKKQHKSKRTMQYIFTISFIALGFAIYKSMFNESKVGDTQELEQRENESKEEAIEALESLDIEELDIEELDTEDLEVEDLDVEELDIE